MLLKNTALILKKKIKKFKNDDVSTLSHYQVKNKCLLQSINH